MRVIYLLSLIVGTLYCVVDVFCHQDAVNASPNVIQPHHNEIIDLLRTVNIIHERPAPPPLDPKDMERRKKEQERHMVSLLLLLIAYK